MILVPKSLSHKETIASKRAHNHEAWDPDWIDYIFTAWGQCSHPTCKEEFVISGTGGVEPAYGPEGEYELEKYFRPTLIRPMPDIIEIPQKCPDDVAKELRSAFELFCSHRASCAGRIRVALEGLMDHVGVPKRRKDSQGKYYDLSLHRRIETFAKNDPAAGTQLMALKWLGNSGSHKDASVTRADLLDAFEIMEHALGEIIDQRSARVAALAKKLAKKHGG